MNTRIQLRTNRQRNLLAVAILCALAVVPAVQAADQASAAAPTTGQAGEDEAARLDAVTVTAQKREQASVDVPASVTAVRTERLARAGLTQLEDYSAQIPGLSITSNGGSMQVTSRGISTGLSQAAPTTGIYIDEAPIGSVNAYTVGSGLVPDIDPADLAQIEMLKGPQGTLFGAGAMGGVLRYVTRSPDFDAFSGSVTLGANSVAHGGDGHVGRASINLPASETLAFRVSAFERKDAGYIDNPLADLAGAATRSEDINDVTTRGGRAAMALKFGEQWRLDAFAITQDRDADGNTYIDVNAGTLQPVAGNHDHAVLFDEPSRHELDLVNATVRGYLGTFAFTSATTWQTVKASASGDATGSFGLLLGLVTGDFGYGVRTNQNTYTKRLVQEFRLDNTAFDDKLYYSTGLYFTSEDDRNRIPGFDTINAVTGEPRVIYVPGTSTPFPGGLATARIDSSYEEVSVFANATYSFNEKFDLQGGIRFGRDEQDYDQYYYGLLFTPPVALVQEDENDKFQYLLTGSFRPREDSTFYGRIATGYRPGGPSAATPITGASPVVDSDSLTSFEAGYKTIAWDNRLSFEAAVFHTVWEDIQIQTSAAGSQFFVNGGEAVSQGAEATLGLYPIEGLSLRGSIGYTDAALTEDTEVLVNAGTPAARPLGLDGDRLPFVPEWTSSLVADYRWAAFGDWSASIGGSINFVGDRDSNYSGRGNVPVPLYTSLNANASIENANWLITLYGKNLGDDDGIIYLVDRGLAPFTPNAPFAAGLIRPRTIGVDVTYRF